MRVLTEFNTPTYSDEKTKKARKSLIISTYLLILIISVMGYTGIGSGIGPALNVVLGLLSVIYLVGNYKFFIIEERDKKRSED